MPTLADIKNRIDIRLNNYLCEMKPDHDDSITGFNEAWTIMDDVFKDVFSETSDLVPPVLGRADHG